jgi:hypothetical protein
MPFSTNAMEKFMRMMDNIFQPFKNSLVVIYLDDILIFNKTWVINFAAYSIDVEHLVVTLAIFEYREMLILNA